jgi:hypothetical protein
MTRGAEYVDNPPVPLLRAGTRNGAITVLGSPGGPYSWSVWMHRESIQGGGLVLSVGQRGTYIEND